jgi:hypothetical protein
MQTLIILLFMLPIKAELSLPNLKHDIESHEASLNYQKNMGSIEKIKNATWLPDDASIHSFRYLHAVIAAAFHAEQGDQKSKARQWLDHYQCENALACRDFEIALDVVSRTKTKKDPWLEKIKADLVTRTASFRSQIPIVAGLCTENSERAKWLELAYQAYCPSFETLSEQTNCAGFSQEDKNCSTTHALVKSIEFQSSQLVINSSSLMNYKHLGKKDCNQDWKVEMLCSSAGKETTYKINCKRLNKSFPIQLKCEEEAVN